MKAKQEYGVFLSISTLSKSCGARVSPYAAAVLRLIDTYLARSLAADSAGAGGSGGGGAKIDPNEMREHALMALDALIRHCAVGVVTELHRLLPTLKVQASFLIDHMIVSSSVV